MSLIGRLLCQRGHHDWRVDVYGDGQLSDGRAFCRVGESVPCRRGCGAVAFGTDDGWVVKQCH